MEARDKNDMLTGERVVILFKKKKNNTIFHGSGTHNKMRVTFRGDVNTSVICTIEQLFMANR
jgi:hypothetical protein